MKKQMPFFKRLYCRCFQAVLRLAMPLMPYRAPELLADVAAAARLAESKGKRRALLVTDKGVAAHGLADGVRRALEARSVACETFDATPENPTVSAIGQAYALYREKECDCLIAVGGGSPIDCAKGVAAKIMQPDKPLQKMKGLLKVHGRRPLFIAVPTTAGTGSEATVAAVVTDDETHDKFTILSFRLMPRYALLDPELTRSLPPAPTAETGLDALTHAVEAYIGRATTRRTRRLCVSAVTRIRTSLLAAYRDGNDLAARRNMQLAAYEAGSAFTVSYVGYVHALAHALGGMYRLPHGRTNAVLLPVVLKAYGTSCEKRLARLALESGVCGASSRKIRAEKFIEWIETLNRTTGIPERIGFDEKEIPALAKHADREANPLYPVPRLMDAKALGSILRAVRADR